MDEQTGVTIKPDPYNYECDMCDKEQNIMILQNLNGSGGLRWACPDHIEDIIALELKSRSDNALAKIEMRKQLR